MTVTTYAAREKSFLGRRPLRVAHSALAAENGCKDAQAEQGQTRSKKSTLASTGPEDTSLLGKKRERRHPSPLLVTRNNKRQRRRPDQTNARYPWQGKKVNRDKHTASPEEGKSSLQLRGPTARTTGADLALGWSPC